MVPESSELKPGAAVDEGWGGPPQDRVPSGPKGRVPNVPEGRAGSGAGGEGKAQETKPLADQRTGVGRRWP